MLLFTGSLLLGVVLTNLLWKPPDPRYHTILSQRVVEFICFAPWLSLTITGWVGLITWMFFIGDNHSLFWDFFHYGTFALGLGLAAVLSFVLVKKSLIQWGINVGLSLVALVIIISSGYLGPPWDGFTAEGAAERIARRVPVPNAIELVPAPNPTIPKNTFSSFDRTYLLMGPNEAVGRVIVRPYLPLYWTRKRMENYGYAERELAGALRNVNPHSPVEIARTRQELEFIIDKYPGSKVAGEAKKWQRKLGGSPHTEQR